MLPAVGDLAVLVQHHECTSEDPDLGTIGFVSDIWVFYDMLCTTCNQPSPSLIMARFASWEDGRWAPLIYFRRIGPEVKVANISHEFAL